MVQLHAPHFQIYKEETSPIITEDEDSLTFTSGKLTARIAKASSGWCVEFLNEKGEILTSSGYHGMQRALDRDTGKSYMSDSLMLDVGEYVYGLGEDMVYLLKIQGTFGLKSQVKKLNVCSFRRKVKNWFTM